MRLKRRIDEEIGCYLDLKKAIQDVLNPEKPSIKYVTRLLPSSYAVKIYKKYSDQVEIDLIKEHEVKTLEKVLELVEKELKEAGIEDNA